MAKKQMIRTPEKHVINIPAKPTTGYICNGCGYSVSSPMDKCPKCGDDEEPVFSKVD